jgi:putative peptidoglycan lipid II flippase
MYVSLLSILVNICVSVVLLKYFHLGYAALALSTSIVAIVSSLCLFEALRRKLGGIEGRYLLDRVARIIGASLLMTAAVASVHYLIGQYASATRRSYLGDLAICLPLGLIVLAIASRGLGVDEIDIASDMFFGPLRRSFLAARARIRT